MMAQRSLVLPYNLLSIGRLHWVHRWRRWGSRHKLQCELSTSEGKNRRRPLLCHSAQGDWANYLLQTEIPHCQVCLSCWIESDTTTCYYLKSSSQSRNGHIFGGPYLRVQPDTWLLSSYWANHRNTARPNFIRHGRVSVLKQWIELHDDRVSYLCDLVQWLSSRIIGRQCCIVPGSFQSCVVGGWARDTYCRQPRVKRWSQIALRFA